MVSVLRLRHLLLSRPLQRPPKEAAGIDQSIEKKAVLQSGLVACSQAINPSGFVANNSRNARKVRRSSSATATHLPPSPRNLVFSSFVTLPEGNSALRRMKRWRNGNFLSIPEAGHGCTKACLHRQRMRVSDDAETIMPLQVAFGMKCKSQSTMEGGPTFIRIVRNLDIDVVRRQDFRFVEFQRLGNQLAACVTIAGVRGNRFKVGRRLQSQEYCIKQAFRFRFRQQRRRRAVLEIEAFRNFTERGSISAENSHTTSKPCGGAHLRAWQLLEA